MTPAEYAELDAVALAESIASGAISAHAVASLALEGVARLNPVLNCVVEAYPDRVDALHLHVPAPGRLAGVPTLLKDFYKYDKGRRTEGGSELTRGLVADHDSELVRRMHDAGLIIVGRSTVPEMAYSSTCDTHIQGRTSNPWNLATFPGGSSSGAAAAVAAGIVPVAHASDGGGSIRSPAAYCGLVGLKPTRGRVSDGPDSADPTGGMSANLAVTRTVRDTAAVLDALAGPAIGDPHRAPVPERPFFEEIGRPIERLRVRFTHATPDGGPVHPEVAAAVRTTAALLADAGHAVDEGAPPLDWEPFLKATHTVWAAGMTQGCNALGRLVGRVPSAQNLMRTSWRMYEYGATLSAADYLDALGVFNTVRRSTGAFFENCDLLVTPTCTQLAAPHASQHQDLDLSPLEWTELVFRTDVFSPVFNVTGQPAISLPLFVASDGSQIGVQLVARFADEALLLRIGSWLESVLPWRTRRPAVHLSRT